MLVFLALGDAKVPNANDFASQWNIGLTLGGVFTGIVRPRKIIVVFRFPHQEKKGVRR